MKDVMVALISAGIPAMIALITLLIEKNKKLEKLEAITKTDLQFNKHELEFHSVFFSAEFLIVVHERIEDIFKKTRADRFLILYAINGKTNFNTVTVCYEMGVNNKVIGATKRYNKFQIDDAYRNMLKRCEFEKTVILDVKNMEDCLLKTVYQSHEEGVHHSIIKFVARIKINNDNDVIVYTSVATKSTQAFPKEELILIKYNSDQIREGVDNIIIH